MKHWLRGDHAIPLILIFLAACRCRPSIGEPSTVSVTDTSGAVVPDAKVKVKGHRDWARAQSDHEWPPALLWFPIFPRRAMRSRPKLPGFKSPHSFRRKASIVTRR